MNMTRFLTVCGVLALCMLAPARGTASSTAPCPIPNPNTATGTWLLPGIPDGRGGARDLWIFPPEVLIGTVAPSTQDGVFSYQGVQGHSYSVEAFAGFPSGTFVFTGPVTLVVTWGAAGDTACPTTDITGAGLRDTSLIDPSPGNANILQRSSFTAPSTGIYAMHVTNTSATQVGTALTATDTTMFSPMWNTNKHFNTYYSFQNTTNATCNITLRLSTAAGVLVTSTSLAISTGRKASTNTATLGTPRNMTGMAQLTHDCPPGAIFATASIADFTTTPAYNQFVPFEATRHQY
jgi:hypothetical protein